MQALLIGGGAREHAIAEALASSGAEVITLMPARNPGIMRLSSSYFIGKLVDKELLTRIAARKPDFAVIGPEAPLDAGVVDFLEEKGVPCVGPIAELARLETSKTFTRQLMEKHAVPGMPRWRSFSTLEDIQDFIDEVGQVVLKPDGLTGGKGVKVQGEHFVDSEDAVAYCAEVLKTHPSIVVEEKLEGEEFSLQCLTDGKHIMMTPPAQDHKRAFEDDQGPNTGGMGSYSCENHLLPFLTYEDVEDALEITHGMVRALYSETGKRYKGVMYGGFMLTRKGVKLIEYNARFGDPETMNVLPLLETNFADICKAVCEASLNRIRPRFARKATVCKYVVPQGYPDKPVRDVPIEIGESQARIYHASLEERKDGLFLLGSRAAAFLGIGDSVEEAEKIAQQGVESVKGPVFFRRDIGTKALLQKRINHMRQII
ncbi:MAG: phosphoribosylamine--glycine ligase [Nanoarchaeota archaeon]